MGNKKKKDNLNQYWQCDARVTTRRRRQTCDFLKHRYVVFCKRQMMITVELKIWSEDYSGKDVLWSFLPFMQGLQVPSTPSNIVPFPI